MTAKWETIDGPSSAMVRRGEKAGVRRVLIS